VVVSNTLNRSSDASECGLTETHFPAKLPQAVAQGMDLRARGASSILS
jgi:hypothetical protein